MKDFDGIKMYGATMKKKNALMASNWSYNIVTLMTEGS